MYGVISPGVSAGSNQVGASETWMPQLSWPCGPAARAISGTPTAALKAAPPMMASRRLMPELCREVLINVPSRYPFQGFVATVGQPHIACLGHSGRGACNQGLCYFTFRITAFNNSGSGSVDPGLRRESEF